MRRLFWQMSVTLDGMMEGPSHELDDTASMKDEGFEEYASEMLRSIGAVLLGRRTYQLFADYWPKATGADADRLNQLPKIVFSRTLAKPEWNNSRVVSNDVAAEVTRLKQQPGRDLAECFRQVLHQLPQQVQDLCARPWTEFHCTGEHRFLRPPGLPMAILPRSPDA